MDDAHTAESNEIPVFPFLFFELWSILYSIVVNSELGIFANLIQTLTSEVGDLI